MREIFAISIFSLKVVSPRLPPPGDYEFLVNPVAFPLWISLIWVFNWYNKLKTSSHWSHLNFFSPSEDLCTSETCLFRRYLRLNDSLQILHLWFFSKALWMLLKWYFKPLLLLNSLSQISHLREIWFCCLDLFLNLPLLLTNAINI